MKDKIYIGIDPGKNGFLAAISEDGYDFLAINKSTYSEIAEWLCAKNRYQNTVVAIEEVHAIFGSSAKGTFQFGYIAGALAGIVTTLGIPLNFVPPKTWQKMMWTTADKVLKDTKRTSYNAAVRLFPGVDLRATEQCEKADHNKVDALLIAEYARRNNL